MKKLIISIALVLSAFIANGQNITGKWNGKLNLRGRELTIVFNLKQTANGLVASMDSPDQKVFDLATTAAVFEQSCLKIKIENAGIQYEGTLNQYNQIVGNLTQSGEVFSLNLSNPRISKSKEMTNEPNLAIFKFSIDPAALLSDIID
ncbi:MAG: hypothetical protein WCG08_06800 [Paludibacter sp.]|jgi:uncharacterized protein